MYAVKILLAMLLGGALALAGPPRERITRQIAGDVQTPLIVDHGMLEFEDIGTITATITSMPGSDAPENVSLKLSMAGGALLDLPFEFNLEQPTYDGVDWEIDYLTDELVKALDEGAGDEGDPAPIMAGGVVCQDLGRWTVCVLKRVEGEWKVVIFVRDPNGKKQKVGETGWFPPVGWPISSSGTEDIPLPFDALTQAMQLAPEQFIGPAWQEFLIDWGDTLAVWEWLMPAGPISREDTPEP